MRARTAIACALAALVVVGCGSSGSAPGEHAKPVTVALDFAPNAAHAGIYAARAKRLDAARGVRLAIRVPSASTDSLKLLAAGRADLAVVDIHDLGLARQQGADLVGVAALVQRPLASVLARPPVRRPRELEGRRVGVTGLPSDDAVLRAVVEGDGGDFARVRRVTIGFSAVPSLIARKVAGATAFWNVEGVTLRQRGVPIREFRVDDYGAPHYPELVLVTTRAALDAKRDLIGRALSAIRAGTEAALTDPAPVVDAIASASNADARLVSAELVAIRPALTPPLALSRTALERWARFDARFGILARAPDVARAFDFEALPRDRG